MYREPWLCVWIWNDFFVRESPTEKSFTNFQGDDIAVVTDSTSQSAYIIS